MSLIPITPLQAQSLLGEGAKLIDIRSEHEFADGTIAGAENQPLGSVTRFDREETVIFLCRTGKRTEMNAAELAAVVSGKAYLVEGGLEAWRSAKLPLASKNDGRVSLAGLPLALVSVFTLVALLLAWMYSDWWLLVPALAASDLINQGLSGNSVIARMWQRISGFGFKVDPP